MDEGNSREIRSFAQGSSPQDRCQARGHAGAQASVSSVTPCLLPVSGSWAFGLLTPPPCPLHAPFCLSVCLPVCVPFPLLCLSQAALTSLWSCSCSPRWFTWCPLDPDRLHTVCSDAQFPSWSGSASLFSWISGRLPSRDLELGPCWNRLCSLTALFLSDPLPSLWRLLGPGLHPPLLSFLQAFVQNQLLPDASLILSCPLLPRQHMPRPAERQRGVPLPGPCALY